MPKKKISIEERKERINKHVDKNREQIEFYVNNKNIIEEAKNIKPENSPKRLSARSKIYWQLRGFDETDSIILSKSVTPGEYEYFRIFKGISESESKDSYVEHWGSKAVTEENLIKRHGEKEGKRRWKNYCNIQSKTNTFEYKKEKYGWDKETFDKFNRKRAVTKENLIKKHGRVVGLEKWKDYCDKQSYTNKLEYFIEKFGEEEGTKNYNLLCFLKTHSYESYLYRFEDEKIAKENYENYINKFGSYSKIANNLFDIIKNNLSEKSDVYYQNNNYEKSFFDEFNKEFRVDFYYQGKVIEFNGDFWHCHVSLFDDENKILNNTFFKNKTVKDVRERDKKRINFLKSKLGEDSVLVVWEHEYRLDKEKTIKKCLDFLN